MDIGKKLKELRLQNDLTLGDLASRSELTKGFLSQVERNLTTPSIATLQDILEALGSNLSEFFREEEESQIVFRHRTFLWMSRRTTPSSGWCQTHRKMRWSPFYLRCIPTKRARSYPPTRGKNLAMS